MIIMKNRYKFILVLSVTCTILSLCLASFSFSVAVNSNNKEEVPTLDSGDFDKLFYEENFHYFEVSDFAEKDINKINIAAKKYKTNTITVTAPITIHCISVAVVRVSICCLTLFNPYHSMVLSVL